MTNPDLCMLLVSGATDSYWIRQLENSLSGLGKLDLIKNTEMGERLRSLQYDIVILDGTLLTNYDNLIQEILQVQPSTKVVVCADSKDWRRARQAFRDGAADYVPFPTNQEILRDALQSM